MSVHDLRRRLTRIEAGHHVGEPTAILSFRPLDPGEGDNALAHWREWVADDRATLRGHVLFIRSPKPLTVQEWETRFAQDHERLL